MRSPQGQQAPWTPSSWRALRCDEGQGQGPWTPSSPQVNKEVSSVGQMAQIVPVLLPQGMDGSGPQVMTTLMPVQMAWGGSNDDNGCVWVPAMQNMNVPNTPQAQNGGRDSLDGTGPCPDAVPLWRQQMQQQHQGAVQLPSNRQMMSQGKSSPPPMQPPQFPQNQQQGSGGQQSGSQLALSPQQLLMMLQEHQRALAEQAEQHPSIRSRTSDASYRQSRGAGSLSRGRRMDGSAHMSDSGSPTPCATPPNPSLRQHFAAMTGQSAKTPPPPSWTDYADARQGSFTGTVLHPAPVQKASWADYVDGPLPYYLAPPQNRNHSEDGKGDGLGKGFMRGPNGGKGGQQGGGKANLADKTLLRNPRGKGGKPDGGMVSGSKMHQMPPQQQQNFAAPELLAGTGEAPGDGDMYNQGYQAAQGANARGRRARPRARVDMDDNYSGGHGGDYGAMGHQLARTGGAGHDDRITVAPSDTMKAQLQALQEEDPAAVFIARRINKLGFTSADQLRTHFSRYGRVKGVYVSHSRVKSARPYIAGRPPSETHWRLRAAALGFVVMASTDATGRILGDGPDIIVNGVPVRVQEFNRRGDTGGCDLKEDDACDALDELQQPHHPSTIKGAGYARERWCTPEEEPYVSLDNWGW